MMMLQKYYKDTKIYHNTSVPFKLLSLSNYG